MAVSAVPVRARQHIPGRHMPHLVLIGDLGIYPARFYDPIENGPGYRAFEGDHFYTADFAGQHDGPLGISLHVDL